MNNDLTASNPILSRWREICERKSSKAAVISPSGEVLRSYGDLDGESDAFAGEFSDLPRGSVIGLLMENLPEWPAIYLGGLKRGLIWLPLDAGVSESSAEEALRLCGGLACIVSEDREITISRYKNAAVNWKGVQPDYLKMTSGTTAAARVVLFTHEQILADCDQVCETMGIGSDDINYGVIAFSHSYGFSNLITPLICRGVSLVAADDMVPRAVIDGLYATRATVLPGVPPFYTTLLKLKTEIPKELRLLISAGAPLSSETIHAFHQHYGRKIHSFYGASECGGICYDSTEDAVVTQGYVGSPMKDVRLEKTPTETEEGSQYRVHSKAAGLGYFPEDDLQNLSSGAFLPADLLKETGEGYCITGRISDLINVGGKKVNPFQVEAALRKHDGVGECVVFGVPDVRKNEVIHACVVARRKMAEGELKTFCAESLASWEIPHRIHLVEEIPRNLRGKISRKDIAKYFGELS